MGDPKPISKLFAAAICLGFVCLSFKLNWADIRGSYLVDRSAFIETRGVVEHTAVLEYGGGDDEPSWRPQLRYTYVVDDRPYGGSEITFADTAFHTQERAEAFVAARPVGSEVPVFYERGNPGFAVLNPDPHRPLYVEALFFLVGGASLLSGLYDAWRMRRAHLARRARRLAAGGWR